MGGREVYFCSDLLGEILKTSKFTFLWRVLSWSETVMLTVIRRRLREARQGRLVYLVRETRVNMRHTHQTANCLAHVKRKQQHPPPPSPPPSPWIALRKTLINGLIANILQLSFAVRPRRHKHWKLMSRKRLLFFIVVDEIIELLFFTNSLPKLWSDNLLSDCSISQSDSKL